MKFEYHNAEHNKQQSYSWFDTFLVAEYFEDMACDAMPCTNVQKYVIMLKLGWIVYSK